MSKGLFKSHIAISLAKDWTLHVKEPILYSQKAISKQKRSVGD